MSENDQESQSPPAVHEPEEGDTIFDALDKRDLDAIDAECRGLDLVQPLAHFWFPDETARTDGTPAFALTKSGIEEAGRKAGGVDCPKDGLSVERDDTFWHSEQEGISLTSRLRRTGSASAKIVGKWNKPDRFGRRKAVNLSQRNAIAALLTSKQKADMIQHAIDIGSTEEIDPPWKGKKDDEERGTRSSRPPPGSTDTGQAERPQSSRRPAAKAGRPPDKDEALDYYNSIIQDIIADARGSVTQADRLDLTRAVTCRGSDGGFYSAVTMPLERLVGLIRRIERSRDGVVDFLRGDEWEAWLGFKRSERQGETSETEAPKGPSQGEDAAQTGAVLETPECVSRGDDTVPPTAQTEPVEKEPAGELSAGETEHGAPNAGPRAEGSALGTAVELPADATAGSSNADPPAEPETREDAVATCELAITAVFEAAPIEGIGNSTRDRGEVVKQVRQAMRKAIIRTGVSDGRDTLEELSVAELSALAAMIEVDMRAIAQWLTSGRYLTSNAPKKQVDGTVQGRSRKGAREAASG